MSGSYYDQAVLAANNAGVPANLFTAIIGAESNWNPNAYNASSGAAGFGQVLGSTAANPGYGIQPLTNPYDPSANLNFSAQYLAAQYNRTGSWMGATQAYSGTPAGQLPYAGNAQQGNVLAALGSPSSASGGGLSGSGLSGGSTTAASPGTATGSTTGASSGVVGSALAALGALASRGALLVIGLILLFGAVMIFAHQSERS